MYFKERTISYTVVRGILVKVGYILSDEIACTFASDDVLMKIIENKGNARNIEELKHEMFPDAAFLLRFKEFLKKK